MNPEEQAEGAAEGGATGTVPLMAEDLLVAAVAGGLPGSLREFPRGPLSDQQALDGVRTAARLGMAGFMLAAVRSGDLGLPPAAIEALDEAGLQESTTRLYLEQELISVSALLDDADVETRVLGDCAVAHLDYRDPEVRALTRLDLLVRPRTMGRAAEILRRRGWRAPRNVEGSPDRAVELVSPSGPHLVLNEDVGGCHGVVVDPRELWADGDSFVVSGRKVKALGSEQRLLHTSMVAVRHDGARSLVPQRDLVELVLFGQWRRAHLMDLAASWGAQGTLAGAIRASWERLAIADVTALSVWAENYRPEVRRSARRSVGDGGDQQERPRPWNRLRPRTARRS